MRPPGDESLIGLMPVHRGGEERLYGLKTVVVVPGNSARGLDPHQGTVTLFEGETGQTVAVMNASPITAIRTAAASALATRELARKVRERSHRGRRLSSQSAPRSARRSAPVRRHSHRLEDGGEDRGAGRAASGGTRGGVRRGGHTRRRRDHRRDELRGARRRSQVECRRSPHQRGRRVLPAARELDSATVAASTFIADRRESAENESGDYRLALAEGAIADDHIAAELGDVLIGAHPGRALGGRDHGLRVAGRRGRGPLRRRVRRTPHAGNSHGIAAGMIPINEIRRAADVIASGALPTPSRAQLPDAPCELWLKLECLQPVGAFKIRGAPERHQASPCGSAGRRRRHAGAGNMGQAIAWAARNAGVGARSALDHAPR